MRRRKEARTVVDNMLMHRIASELAEPPDTHEVKERAGPIILGRQIVINMVSYSVHCISIAINTAFDIDEIKTINI